MQNAALKGAAFCIFTGLPRVAGDDALEANRPEGSSPSSVHQTKGYAGTWQAAV
jgi:hypothetical protein